MPLWLSYGFSLGSLVAHDDGVWNGAGVAPSICPPPPDCPLYVQHVDYGQDEPLRRAVLMERRSGPRLTDLVRAEVQAARPPIAALHLTPEPEPLPVSNHLNQKGVRHE